MARSRFSAAPGAIRRASAALCLAACCAFPLLASAEPSAPADAPASDARRAEAKARYEEGARAYAERRYKDAVDLFLEADRIVSSAPLSFNIARAYEKLGDSSGALSWYRDYLRRAPEAKNAAEVRSFIQLLEDRLAQKGVQQLSVRSTPRGATVAVDGEPVGVTPWTGDLPPGAHQVTLELKGYSATIRDVDLKADEALDVELSLEPLPEGRPEVVAKPLEQPKDRARPEQASGTKFGVWPYVALGAGAASLGGALFFELSRQSAEEDARGEPTQIGYRDAYESMESRQTVSRVLVGVGGAFLITGGVLLAIELGTGPRASVPELAFDCGTTRCGFSARGRF